MNRAKLNFQTMLRPALRFRAIIPVLLLAGLLAPGAKVDAGQIQAKFNLTATPRVINEGELVEFGMDNLVYFDSETGESLDMAASLSQIDWNFEDGSGGQHGSTLFWVNHRFMDDQLSEYSVRARYAGGQASIDIRVNNVPPEIRSVWHSRPALKELAINFDASATDPGITDLLTYTWRFGDGETAVGEAVEHIYAEDGVYEAMLVVDDGDGGEDTETFLVTVGSVGQFTVSGDVSLPTVEINYLILAGSTNNPLAKEKSGACQLRLQMGDDSGETSFTLTANLDPGIGVRDYSVGLTTEWDGSHKDDHGSQGVFFGDLSLPRDIAIRDFNGAKVGGPFWSESGSVTVQHFDGKFLELSFEAILLENIPGIYDPRRTHVYGTLATHVDRKYSAVLSGVGNVFSAAGQSAGGSEDASGFKGANFYLCRIDESKPYDIEQHTPVANALNTDFLNPTIEISFTEAVDPASIHDNVHLEFRSLGGFGAIPGSWQPVGGDKKSIQFIPQAHLLDGVIYCVRVDTGEDGIRGRKGEMLIGSSNSYSSTNAAACQTNSTNASGGAQAFAFSTRVELNSARVDLYQASIVGEGTPLVGGKPTLARVYPAWTGLSSVHRTAKVRKFPALVTVKSGGQAIYAPRRADIRLPSEISHTDKINLRNSVNFFNWRPSSGSGTSSITALIEPMDETGAVIEHSFEGEPTIAGHWDRKQQLKIDFHFIKVEGECAESESWGCDWSSEIDPGWREMARNLMLEAGRFTTQVFPVVSTVSWYGPDVNVWEPLPGPCSADYAPGRDCYWSGHPNRQRVKTGWVAEDLLDAGSGSDADVLVGIVPPGFTPSSTAVGSMVTVTGKRVVLVKLGSINAAGVAHEYGHFFDLDHCPIDIFGDEDFCSPTPIQGFRMNAAGQSGFNKNHLEGNQQGGALVPVMHFSQQEPAEAFITTSQYALLFDALENAYPSQAWTPINTDPPSGPKWFETLFLPASAYAAEPAEHLTPTLLVSGNVRGREILIQRIRPLGSGEAAPASRLPGPYTLELKDASGNVLQSTTFSMNTQDRWHGDPTQASQFRISVAEPDGLHSISVSGPVGTRAEVTRSANPPQISASVSRHGSDGSRVLNWSTSDADNHAADDELHTDVYIRADNEGPWQGVAIGIDQNELRIPADQLIAGASISAKITVSDGFNSSSTELEIGAGRPLSVLATMPRQDEKTVALNSDIIAWVSNPLHGKQAGTDPIALPEGQFRLYDSAGKPVMADAFYLPAENILTLNPVEPLSPENQYTATVMALNDRWNNSLGAPHSWSFETEAGDATIQSQAQDEFAIERKVSNKRAFPPTEQAIKPEPASASPGVGTGLTPDTGPGSMSFPGMPAEPASECTCACDERATADELCELLCEEEFAACQNP